MMSHNIPLTADSDNTYAGVVEFTRVSDEIELKLKDPDRTVTISESDIFALLKMHRLMRGEDV